MPFFICMRMDECVSVCFVCLYIVSVYIYI